MKKMVLFLLLLSTFASHGQITSVALVGEAAGGWPGSPNDPGPTDFHQMTSTDGENWTLESITLTNSQSGGGLKFRANNDWNLNWGTTDFPTGIGLQNGANIPCVAGTYAVYFNSTTGVYSFSGAMPIPIVKLVGSAVNASSGILMLTNDAAIYTISNVDLTNGYAQFDADGNLYGGDVFPAGTVVDSVLQIPVIAGNYSSITLNITTGEYNFVASATYPLISLTGTAVGGAGDGFDFDMTTADGIHYSYPNLGTIDGTLQFRSGHAWGLNYGSNSFPEGIAILNGAPIPVPLGTWSIEFNLSTGAYTFTGTSTFPTISIVGSGAGGWPGDQGNPGPYDNNQMTTTDGINYTIYALPLTDGELKFRQDNAWTINWGDTAFPTGIAVQNGPNIVTVAGTYTVQFNRITGVYTFGNPNRVAIVGSGAGGWPTGTVGEIDANQLTSTDGVTFILNNISLTDGFVKFRQNNSWDVNWGGTSLFGTLVLNGPDIPTAAGTYSVAMNRVTGTYAFAEPLATIAFRPSTFSVYPNPTNSVWNVASTANKNIVSIKVVDVLGKTVLTINPAATAATVDASSLNSGLYFAKIATANATETVKLMKN